MSSVLQVILPDYGPALMAAAIMVFTRPNGSELPPKAAGARWQALPIRLEAVSRLRVRFSPMKSAIISLVQESVSSPPGSVGDELRSPDPKAPARSLNKRRFQIDH